MRLRQVALVGENLAELTGTFCDVLGIEVAYRDPGVAVFGLENALMPIGDAFLEIVSPVAEDAPARRYRDRRGGDAGYMVMLQTGSFAADRQRLDALGVRIVWEGELPDIRGMHLHPKDTGGALLSLDEPTPPESWRWAGSDWAAHVRRDRVTALLGATIGCPDPEATAARWGELIGHEVLPGAEPSIALAPGMLRFVPGNSAKTQGLVGFTVATNDPHRVVEAAKARGLETGPGHVVICGTRIDLEG